MAIYPIKNNSKKISELTPRDIITYHQAYSWIPIAQYDHRIDSYVNLAINIAAITSYSTAYSYNLIHSQRVEDFEKYKPEEWEKLLAIGEEPITYTDLSYLTNIGELIENSSIANNLITYNYSYVASNMGWEYFNERNYSKPTYIFDENEEYVLDAKGNKIISD